MSILTIKIGEGFSYYALEEAARLLERIACTEPIGYGNRGDDNRIFLEEIKFNPNTDAVYAVDEHGNYFKVNREGKLEQYYVLHGTGIEGFYEDLMKMYNEGDIKNDYDLAMLGDIARSRHDDLYNATRESEKYLAYLYDRAPRFELREAYYDAENEIPCAFFDTYLPDDIRKDFVEKSQKFYKRDLVCEENTKISTHVAADGELSICFNYDKSREFFTVPLNDDEKKWLFDGLVNECQNKGKTLDEYFREARDKYAERQKQQRNAVKDDR